LSAIFSAVVLGIVFLLLSNLGLKWMGIYKKQPLIWRLHLMGDFVTIKVGFYRYAVT